MNIERIRASRASRRAADWRLPVTGPFHLEATVRVLQRRPTDPVDLWERGRYRRLFATPHGLALVDVVNRGTVDAPDVRCVFRAGKAAAAAFVDAVLRNVLGLDVDPQPLQRFAADEPALHATVAALRGMRPPRFPGFFETFARVIPFQQLSIDAGVAIVARLVRRFGDSVRDAGGRYFAFPTADAIAAARIARLRACGLSTKKAQTLRYIARLIASGALRAEEIAEVGTAEALRLLTELPGIGPWSAALVLLRGFGRLDVFPPKDVGAARALAALLRLDADAPIEHVVRRFGDRRGYLYFCGLGSSLLANG
ncbi:MAG TPA: AlkA N-terminal domain-containing protein, partial [Burkholderiales bacterium]